jgi:hypothetical protein
MESAQKATCFRTVLAGFVPRSRTLTRTISAHHAPEPFGQISTLAKVVVAALRSMCGAKENLSLEILMPTWVGPRPLADYYLAGEKIGMPDERRIRKKELAG